MNNQRSPLSDHRKEIIGGLLIVLLVLFFDQYLKIWVKTHMTLGEQRAVIGNWFYLHFIENPGMAFGWKFWGDTGKILLTVFRIVAATGISIYILRMIRKGISTASLVFFSLILAGAVGNIIDSIFYGPLFTHSFPGELAQFADGNGYAPYFKGSVVDMLYFPLIDTTWPDWMPFLKGKPLQFFRPVFNIADAAITIGVLGMLLFQRSVFSKSEDEDEIDEEEEARIMEDLEKEFGPVVIDQEEEDDNEEQAEPEASKDGRVTD